MHKIRGFRIRHKLVKVIKQGLLRRQRNDSNYLNPPNYTTRAMSKLCRFAQWLKKSAKNICGTKSSSSNYIRLGEKMVDKCSTPKGHLAVYVGEKEDDAHRVLVPVIYFNHPLFDDLLREAEKVYGFHYEGGIHVPCRISEFQKLQTKISASGGGCHGSRARRNWGIRL
ncbi:auxin-responsive protein SAUR36-like [Rutidosis leptorrhynchoides]|uniref:auxin-responsive protein SAUR36-like n=1 Tax=Rutidosis leptorrhynchoides TaxID=125765 RepID=UPI003A993A25